MLIGRGDELARIEAALAAGSVVALTGEAGAGKTALLAEALERSRRPVRAGQCFRSLSWTPGVPLQQALRSPLPTGDPLWVSQWVARGLHGSVLRLDDLQWADPLTLAVLELLPPSTACVVSVRTGDPGTDGALAVLTAMGAEVIDVGALDEDPATELALAAHPELRPAEARALARRAEGNPLLIQELGLGAEPSRGLRRSVAGRLRRLGPQAWRGFAILALADEPLPRELVPSAAELIRASFVVDTDAGLQARHGLLAEAVSRELADGPAQDRVDVARDLADRAEDAGLPALAARAAAAAGDRRRALGHALVAADATDRPGLRAGLLHLAATCADGDEASALASRAVAELVRSGDYGHAAELIDALPHAGGARWFGLVGRVRWQNGDDDAALAAYEAGLAIAEPGTADALLLQIEQARAVLLGLGDVVRGLELARAAHRAADAAGLQRPRALAVLGTAMHQAGVTGGEELMLRAIEAAALEDDYLVEFTSANNLISMYESTGCGELATALAARYADRAEALHLRHWQVQMQAMGWNAAMHLGHYDPILADLPPVLAQVVEARTRDQLACTLTLALVDLGRHEAVMTRLADALAVCTDGYLGRGNLVWIRAEAHLWTGNDPAAARADALEAIALTPTDSRVLLALVTLAHANAELGEPIEVWSGEVELPILAGAPIELAGLAARARGESAEAAALFTEAAGRWRGLHRRGEVRCRWLAADAEPDRDAAVAALTSLADELADAGMAPLLGRVRRSLRARGVRSAARGRSGDVTAREREVLDLVAAGLSTDAVAGRLGLAPSTVAALIASARARLGARSRWQAASG